jgi:hypothetical protein
MKRFLVGIALWASSMAAFSQTKEDIYANKFTVAFGLTQPIVLKGFNVAGTYFTKNWTFEYSHGVNLKLEGAVNKDKNTVSTLAKYSTGLGVGYRLTRFFDVRLEAKAHEFTTQLNKNEAITYTNFDLGAGAYYRIYPFKKSTGALKGLHLEPSVRYWQFVKTNMPNEATPFTTEAGQAAVHKPYNFGLFANVSLAYTFGL